MRSSFQPISSRVVRSTHSLAERALAWLVIAAMLGTGCVVSPAPDPLPGLPEFHGFGVVAVPGGLYDVAGSNLLVQRSDVSVDTRIVAGNAISATWNSATAEWHWSHRMHFDGTTFVDSAGAVHDVSGLSDGAAIPGTVWVRVDTDTIKTKGGLAHDFDGEGRLEAIYWTSDPYPRTRFVYATSRVEQRECVLASQPVAECRLVFQIDRGPHGPTRIVDAESARVGVARESNYAYDAAGRLVQARTPFEVDEGLAGTRYEYAGGGMLTAATDSEGTRIEYRWAFGRLLQVTQVGEGDPSHAFTYPQLVDEQASLFSVVHANPLGGRTRYVFTDGGHIREIERIDVGETLLIEWHPGLNRPARIVEWDGSVLEFEAWHNDDPTRLVQPSGNVREITYAADAVDFDSPFSRPVASVQDSLGSVRSVDFDGAGRPISVTNGEGESVDFDYVGAEISRATAPWGDRVDFVSYAVHGHWRTAEVSWVPETSIQRRLDRVGNLLVPGAGIQAGGVLERGYDASRRLASLQVGATDEDGVVTATDVVSAVRRSDGQLSSVSRPGGGDHAFEHDALGRVVRMRERVDGTFEDTVFAYDGAGNLVSVERPNGMREELDYDLYGRTVERRTLRHGALEDRARFVWSQGRMVRWYDSVRDQWEIHDYDAAGRLASVTWSRLGETLLLEYDLRSRIVRKTFQLGSESRVVEIEWDLADRRTRVSTRDADGSAQDLVRLDYQQGRLAAIEYGNGLRRENLYDAQTGRFGGYRTLDLATADEVEQTTISREAMTGPTRLEVTSHTETPLASTVERYWLGLGGNLQSESRKIGARVFRWQAWTLVDGVVQHEDEQRYAWDALGNRIDDTEGNALAYNVERNRLLEATVNGVSHSYTYDEAGFATSRDGLAIGWTAAGRMARVGPASNPLVEVRWDMAGRPVSVTALGATREFALFGGRVEYDGQTGAVGWLDLAHVSLPFAGDERIYRHLDGLGNVGFTSDASGAVTSHRRYHPFGLDRVYGAESFTEDDPHGFVGGIELRHDGVETGLVVLGARVLDSDVGRFLSPDPVFNPLNPYVYAYGNPVSWEDDDGRFAAPKGAEAAAAELELRAAQSDARAAQAEMEAKVLATGSATMITLSFTLASAEPRAAATAWGIGTALGAAAAIRSGQAAGHRADAARFRLRAAEIRAGAGAGGATQGSGQYHFAFAIPMQYEWTPPVFPECGPGPSWTRAGRVSVYGPLLTLLALSLLVTRIGNGPRRNSE